MRENWIDTNLGEVADIYQPQTIAKALMDDFAEYIVYGANGPIGRYHQFNHAESEVVVTCRGATCGTINMTPEKTWITGNAMVVHPKSDSLDKQFLFYSLISVVDVHSIISGSAQPQITREGMLQVKISIPPLSEQKRIVDLISSVDSYIEAISYQNAKNDKGSSLLGCLVKLRAALLSDLLTGKHVIPTSYDSFLGKA
jgi:restriction endonuclease S subunit